MKKSYFLIALLLIVSINASAQFVDDMESYIDGEPISGVHWTDWNCDGGPGCALMSTSVQSYNGNLSGLIPGDETTDAVLDLGNKPFGEWWLSFWMYIPLGKEAYWNLQGEVPIGAGEWIVGNVFFNQDLASPGVGLIDDTALGEVNFTFPHDQWFRVIMKWDLLLGISLATWEMYVDGNEVIPFGTPFTSVDGTTPTSLGGISFFSISADNELYVDDFNYMAPIIFDIDDFSKKVFNLYPNPTKGVLNMEAQEPVESIRIYNLLGSLVKEVSFASSIDVSHLKAGMYIIEVTTESGKSVQQFIKE